MRRYEGVHFVLIAPKELALPDYMKAELGNAYTEVSTLEEAMPVVDVLYMTRVQQERFADKDEYERLKDSFILDERLMELGKPSMIVLHPLPRVNEITVGVDKDPRAAYFRQVENGKYVRKAIIYTLLSDEYMHAEPTGHHGETSSCACHNDRCIATTEPVEQKSYIDADGVKRCFYCDHML
jgi:aspartate carbamoyltransferase catalytic subunit